MGVILWARRLGALELVQIFLKLIGHGNVASASRVIPLDVETTEQGSGPIHGDGVLFLEGLDQVITIFFAKTIDTKVVDYKVEGDVTRHMLPDGRGVGYRRIAKLGKVDFEMVIGDAAGLFETWHAFVDLHIDPSVGADETAQVVLFDNLVRE